MKSEEQDVGVTPGRDRWEAEMVDPDRNARSRRHRGIEMMGQQAVDRSDFRARQSGQLGSHRRVKTLIPTRE